MKRALLVVILWLLVSAWMMVTKDAYAAPVTTSPITEGDGSIVPGASPSRAHRWGTVMIYGTEVDHVTLDQALVGVEWATFEKRVVRRFGIDRMPLQTGTVQSAHIEDNTFLAFGSLCGGDSPAFLYWLDRDGAVLERIDLSGCGPSIVANDTYVVVGLYEDAPPVLPPDHKTGWQPRSVYHVRVYDRRTRQLVGARVFRGDVLLAPKWLVTSQMLALQGDRVFVSLPMIQNARIIGARLPSLVTDAQADLAVPRDPEASASIAAFKGGIVALADGWVELSADLVVRKRREAALGPAATFVAIEPRSGRVFVDSGPPRGLDAGRVPSELVAQSLTWAWGHPVALGLAQCTGACLSTYGPPSLIVLP
jgi:hypothetical protein